MIAHVGKSEEIEKTNVERRRSRRCHGDVVMPGFVDAHAHPVFAGNRVDEFEMRAQRRNLRGNRRGRRRDSVDCAKTRAQRRINCWAAANKHAEWFIRCGTTTVEAKSGYGLSVEDEIKILRVMRRLNRGDAARICSDIPGRPCRSAEEFRSCAEQSCRLVIDEDAAAIAEREAGGILRRFLRGGTTSTSTPARRILRQRPGGMDWIFECTSIN